MRRKALLLTLGSAMALFALIAAIQTKTPSITNHSARKGTAVLELFTSQGCSSCPPADALLSRLGSESFTDGTVIPLAYHVDYWNSLGWTDPFSSPRWSARQRDYARTLQLDQVYTPQLIVNGRAQLVGSAESGVRAEVHRQLERGDAGTIDIERVARQGPAAAVTLRARLDRAATGDANVVVVLFENGAATAVVRGENSGRRLLNDAIVRWQGNAASIVKGSSQAEASITIPLEESWSPRNLGVAAFVQDAHTSEIYAAASRHL